LIPWVLAGQDHSCWLRSSSRYNLSYCSALDTARSRGDVAYNVNAQGQAIRGGDARDRRILRFSLMLP
jgi:hypothetical protein